MRLGIPRLAILEWPAQELIDYMALDELHADDDRRRKAGEKATAARGRSRARLPHKR